MELYAPMSWFQFWQQTTPIALVGAILATLSGLPAVASPNSGPVEIGAATAAPRELTCPRTNLEQGHRTLRLELAARTDPPDPQDGRGNRAGSGSR